MQSANDEVGTDWPALMPPKDAGAYLTKFKRVPVSQGTLANWRDAGRGGAPTPKFRRTRGGSILYAREDLDAWAADELSPAVERISELPAEFRPESKTEREAA